MSDTDGNDAGGGNAPEAQSSDAAASAPKPAPDPAQQPTPHPAAAPAGGVNTPWHLWVIGIIAVLWNAIGAFDYTATQLRLDFYMSQFTQAQLDYYYSFPLWILVTWGVATWGAVLGSIALLLRKSWAVWLFGLSILGIILTAIYTIGIAPMTMNAGQWIFTLLIWAIAIFLFFYARAMKKAGVLT